MNFSAGLSLLTNLVLKHLGSVFECHTDSSLRVYNTISSSNLATMKPLVGISPVGMKLMFSEYILGQYLTLISDVISWVEDKHEIMSFKGFFKQFLAEKQSIFQTLKKLLILIAPTSI